MAASSPNPRAWYLDQKYQNYWETFSRLNLSESYQYQASKPEDIRAIAYWRSLALSLQFENNQLHSLLSQMIGANNQPAGPAPPTDEVREKKKKTRSRKRKEIKENSDSTEELKTILEKVEYCPDTNNYNEDEEEEVDEDYLKFLEVTERHREERNRLSKAGEDGGLKKGKKDSMRDFSKTDEEEENIQSQVDLIAVDHERLKREMSSLYGGESLAVHCVETRLQLEFNDWSDLHRPVTWPALPLNIRR